MGHTATSGMLSTDIDVRALPQVTLQNCSIYATFQPPLGFDLGVGEMDLGKKRKSRNVIREKKGSQRQAQEAEIRRSDSMGQGAQQGGHSEAQAGT